MKRIITIFILLLTMSIHWAEAQFRYVHELFDEVSVTSDVVYGGNGTILFFPQTNGDIVYQDLLMDIYEPVGDTEAERPLVLVLHDGNFLPPAINGQIAGSKNDSSSVEICKQLARRGFTAASVTYRLGWNPLASTEKERALGLIQAIYRGVQDGRTAIRYFRKTYTEENNPYHIDPNRITVWGNGPGYFHGGGGFLALAMVGLSDYEEIPLASNPDGKFMLDLDGDGVLETPMVLENFHGDIEGKVTTVVPEDFLGLTAGDTSNYSNHPEYSSDFHLGVNVGGAIAEISWLEDNDIPMITVQSPYDLYTPYDDGMLIFHSGGPAVTLQVQGAKKVGEWLEVSGTNQVWKDMNFDDAITIEASNNSTTYGEHPYYEGVFPFHALPNSTGLYEGVVINWWNPTDPSPISGPCMGLPWNECLHPGGGTFHDQCLILNEEMSASKSKANIAKLMKYFIPRACVALDMDCAGVTAVEETLLSNVDVSLVPNPSNDFFTVVLRGGEMIRQLELFTLDGQRMSVFNEVNRTQMTVNVPGLTPGIYLVKINTGEGVVTKKLVVN